MITRNDEDIKSLISEFIKLPKETEWVEFKQDNKDPHLIGEYISALSNSATLNNKPNAYIVWGVNDKTHEMTGTTFTPSTAKKGNENLDNWLLRLLEPKIDYKFYEISIDNKNIVLLEIASADKHPVSFEGKEYIRFGENKKKLRELPEKEKELWRAFDKTPFEKQIAADNVDASNVLKLLDFTKYFELLKIPLPENNDSIIDFLIKDEIIKKLDNGKYAITNLGAILFAKDINNFDNLKRKAIRVIQYKGNSKIQTIKEIEGKKGFAIGFQGLIEYINSILPSNEVIGQVFREEIKMYPELCIRELVANALIHQDFSQTGNSAIVEIYENRIEITNPGEPLISTDRFLDNPPKSRNERLASFMRRINICEERGSGIDKVVYLTEFYQLPAPSFETINGYTKVTLFAHKELKDMHKEDKIRACYLHCCLKYIQNEYMTNTTLRDRFGIDAKNSSIASKIINLTIEDDKIAIYDENVGTKARMYVPIWSK